MSTRGVGFLKYWTLSNVPLFLLSAPMLYITIHSAMWAGNWNLHVGGRGSNGKGSREHEQGQSFDDFLQVRSGTMRRLLLPQLLLAVLALTNYHVQIINRISSGYPVWYWWLAWLALNNHKLRFFGRPLSSARLVIRLMVVYALIQGGLFASFLPPA